MEIITLGGMHMSRKSAREEVMKLVYQIIMNKSSSEEALQDLYENQENELPFEEKEYIDSCVTGIVKNADKIDRYIEEYSKGWKINRISKVDLAIMRLCIYEMIERPDVPNAAAINEAIELAKKYSGEKSSVFINGILGNIIKVMDKDV
ncbi:MAG: nusB [Clostridiales bacterium]|jgi:N utilization substance protein B|nr:nusB [Clostridiales bacterium]